MRIFAAVFLTTDHFLFEFAVFGDVLIGAEQPFLLVAFQLRGINGQDFLRSVFGADGGDAALRFAGSRDSGHAHDSLMIAFGIGIKHKLKIHVFIGFFVRIARTLPYGD